ncbi:NAD/NADP-dependent octopine/nopaline dehydrogenase family protein [Acidaminobacter hydrogenoformans]|nr:NAD/NADP-dependent octopine/nopaline dehydrogenase family protein [Acidaminobacter hydrogenoformans]
MAIIGAGNGGVSMGAYMALRGAQVNLYDKFESAVESIKERGGIDLKGISLEGYAKFEVVSTSIGEVIKDCSLIMVVTPAFAHLSLAKECAEFIEDGQVIVLHPGRTGGALEFYNAVKQINPEVNFVIAEAQTLIYACRRTGPTEARIMGIKNKVSVAAIPGKDTEKAVKYLNEYYPQFVPAKSIIETSLMNIGAIFHPLPTLLNIARIEASEDFEYYHEGISKSVSMIMTEMDKERQLVAKAFGVETVSAVEWMKMVYDTDCENLYDCIQANKAYTGISAPKSADTRYLSEDVPMSLTPISELGRLSGVSTPYIDMVIEMVSIIHKIDYRKNGRTLERLGIEGLTPAEVIAFVDHP